MDVRRSIEYIEGHEKELVVFNPTDPVAAELADYFATQNVRIATERTASGAPTDLAVLGNSDELLAVVDASRLRELIEDVPGGGAGIADAEYEDVLAHLKETTFTSYDTEQLLYASREIEDRARRVGRGTIHAGFQRCSNVAEQRSIYADLARQGVDVHAYGVPDVDPPDLGSGQFHAVETDEIAETWFVVFDGGGTDAQKTALLAEERAEGTFYGAWTYDPGIVDSVQEHLERTYLPSAGDPRQRSGH